MSHDAQVCPSPRVRSVARAAALALAFALLAVSASAAGTLSVKYRSAANIYLDGGRAQGLAIGDRLLVLSGQKTVAELEVVFVAEQSASCRVVSETRTVRAGDAVVPAKKGTTKGATADAAPEASAPASTPAPTPTAGGVTVPAPVTSGTGLTAPRVGSGRSAPAPWGRARGGVSFGYYKVTDDTSSAFDFEQRTARADVTLSDLGGRPLTLTTRFRSRQDVRARTLSSFGGTDRRQDRLYELALRYEPPDERLVFEVGRIGVSRFVGVGYLDGALVRVGLLPALQIGAFGGRRADVDGLGLQGSGKKYGGFLRLAPGGRWSRSYEAQLAVVREFAEGDVSREYVSLESRFGSGSRWSVFQRAEVDLNRGWRQTLAAQQYQLSNFSLAANLRLSQAASASLAYDSRRNYRTFVNRSVPENVFDSLLHQGLRANLYLGRGNGWSGSLGGGVRLRENDQKNAWSGSASLRRGALFGRDVYFGLDGSGFTGAFGDGLLGSGRVGKRFTAGHNLELSYTRSLYRATPTGLGAASAVRTQRVTQWLRLSGRAELGRGLYLVGDLEFDRGDDLQGTRALFELGYRF